MYFQSVRAEKDRELAWMIQHIAFKYIFYGYRRIHLAIQKEGFSVNRKGVYRIYKSFNLQRQRPRRDKKKNTVNMPLTEPLFSNYVWALDFLFDSLMRTLELRW